jgi:para-nitrobenzyl esterase
MHCASRQKQQQMEAQNPERRLSNNTVSCFSSPFYLTKDGGQRDRNEEKHLRKTLVAAVILSQTFVWAQDIVSIDTGKLQGATADGVTSFKGIPYAAPPMGELRWRPPQPQAAWTDVRQATEYGHDCMQLPFPSDAAPLGTTPSEDCLVANIWVPEHRTGKLPVMVWIYGGGWVNGASSAAVYDGSQFARQGIIFVSFNYRLGRFGFFAHPALTREGKDGLLGNYGYMDQIALLKWVKRNVAAFGGDPDSITVFGESAGGFSVHMLMSSPLATGLFQRAMVESGGGRLMLNSTGLHEGMNGRPSAEEMGVAFARSKSISQNDAAALKKLRALSADAIVDGLNMASMQAAESTYPGPMIDGKIIAGEIQTLYEQGKYQHVPFVVGANSMDIGFSPATNNEELFAPFGTSAKAAEEAYDAASSPDIRFLGMKVASDAFMIEPARYVARTLSAQGQPVWEFRFGYVATSMRKSWPGAPHATEIPFVFDTVKAKYGAALSPADEKIAQQTNIYWANFVKTGNPNGAGLPEWPQYHASSDILMDFSSEGPVAKADPWKRRLDLTEQLVSQQAKARAKK